MVSIDTLLHARWVIPVEPHGTVLEAHAIAINNGRIAAILPSERARREFAAREIVNLPHHALIPGLINTHTHAAMSLFRGLADDLPLMDWLQKHIWPAEARWVGHDFIRDGTQLAIAEMIRSGTTCFSDMYFFPEITAHVAHEAGMRACIGMILIDFPSAYAQTPQEYLHKGLELHDQFKHSGLLTTAFAPHAPYTVSDPWLEKVAMYADELDTPIHMHVHETAHEVEEAVAKTGMRPLARLARLGILGPRLVAVHMTQLEQTEIASLVTHNASVVHCPASNLKLASGFCPVHALQQAGVNVALGTDGAASNNNLDMLEELHLAALLAKGVAGDATALPAAMALRMATLNGARTLGIEARTGSLVAGKAADIAAIDLSGLSSQPVYDPLSHIAYVANRNDVSDVWVQGRRLLSGRQLTTLEETLLAQRAALWRDKISASDHAQ